MNEWRVLILYIRYSTIVQCILFYYFIKAREEDQPCEVVQDILLKKVIQL